MNHKCSHPGCGKPADVESPPYCPRCADDEAVVTMVRHGAGLVCPECGKFATLSGVDLTCAEHSNAREPSKATRMTEEDWAVFERVAADIKAGRVCARCGGKFARARGKESRHRMCGG